MRKTVVEALIRPGDDPLINRIELSRESSGYELRRCCLAHRADGLLYGNPRLVLIQTLSALATVSAAAIGTAAILWTLKGTLGLRPARLEEAQGINDIEHGEQAYAFGTELLRQEQARGESNDVCASASGFQQTVIGKQKFRSPG